jgi:hypothetical protein
MSNFLMKLTFLSFNIEGEGIPNSYFIIKNEHKIFLQIEKSKFYSLINEREEFKKIFHLFINKYKYELKIKKKKNKTCVPNYDNEIKKYNFEFIFEEKMVNILQVWLYEDSTKVKIVDTLFIFFDTEYYQDKVKAIKLLLDFADVDFILFQEFTPKFYFDYPNYNNTVLKEPIKKISEIDENCDLKKNYKLEGTGNVIYFKKKYELQSIVHQKYQTICCFSYKRTYFYVINHHGAPGINMKYERDVNFMNLNFKEKTIIAGDTNARKSELQFVNSKYHDLFEYHELQKKNKYTIDCFDNQYYDETTMRTRYDRAYISKDLTSTELCMLGKKRYEQLKNMFRFSGCISDHYALYFDVVFNNNE